MFARRETGQTVGTRKLRAERPSAASDPAADIGVGLDRSVLLLNRLLQYVGQNIITCTITGFKSDTWRVRFCTKH